MPSREGLVRTPRIGVLLGGTLRSEVATIDEWPGTYYHPKHKAFLVVYVDDFKLAAPAHLPGSKRDNIADVWALIQKHVEMDPPTGPGTFLGCKHILTKVPCEGVPGGQVSVMEYDMEDQLQSAVDLLSLIHI